MPPDNNDVFLYPQNKTLRRAYQAIIHKVVTEKRIVFTPGELILTIMDTFGWEDDSNTHNPEKPPGPRYRRAKNILRTFEGKFTRFNGLRLEVYIFTHDNKKRVSTYSELERLCALDPDLSELIATTEKLDLNQPWQDDFVKNPTYPLSDELAAIDREIAARKKHIRAQLNSETGKISISHKSSDDSYDVFCDEVLGEDFGEK